jgi:hypothetical protein
MKQAAETVAAPTSDGGRCLHKQAVHQEIHQRQLQLHRGVWLRRLVGLLPCSPLALPTLLCLGCRRGWRWRRRGLPQERGLQLLQRGQLLAGLELEQLLPKPAGQAVSTVGRTTGGGQRAANAMRSKRPGGGDAARLQRQARRAAVPTC